MSQNADTSHQPKTPSRTPVPRLTPCIGFNIMCEMTTNPDFFANVLELMNRRGMVSPFGEQPQMPKIEDYELEPLYRLKKKTNKRIVTSQ
ncbi:hypothetical protein EMPS_00020 [Entomortierella parvispora]|uniref:Uncharacterized protein n=1 Tax=Entomortierella parvispora TaxID=205924 RepID=A0A9P3LQG1_9FUNG|nr:hypothetical protein EMPS_00020 [Entomortierella parvispora]